MRTLRFKLDNNHSSAISIDELRTLKRECVEVVKQIDKLAASINRINPHGDAAIKSAATMVTSAKHLVEEADAAIYHHLLNSAQ